MNIDIFVPNIGYGTFEVTEILVNLGDEVKKNQILIVVEGEKSLVEIPSDCNGIVKDIKIKIGDSVKSGSLFMVFQEISTIKKHSIIEKVSNNNIEKNIYAEELKKNNIDIHASPNIRRLARDMKIELFNVIGSGYKGRILYEDLIKYKEKKFKKETSRLSQDYHKSYLENKLYSNNDKLEEIELGFIKKATGKKLYKSWISVPHVTQFDDIDITDLEIFRKKQKKLQKDIKLTILSFIVKVVHKALKEFPNFNSSLSYDNNKLIIKKSINIGIAVDTYNGLLVPVFRNIEKKNISELASEIQNTVYRARNGMLKSYEMQDGSFTISNLGNLTSGHFTPLINIPEVAILGISKCFTKAVWDSEKFVPRTFLPISLSYDHRAIDGVYAAKFINFINITMSDIRNLIM